MTDVDPGDAEYIYSEEEDDDARAHTGASSAARIDSAMRAHDSGSCGSPARAPAHPRTSLGSGLPQEYAAVSLAEVEALQLGVVRDVASVLAVPVSVAHLLLAAHKWDKEKLLDKYVADADGVKRRVGVCHAGGEGPSAAPFSCAVCLDDKLASEGFHLGCG